MCSNVMELSISITDYCIVTFTLNLDELKFAFFSDPLQFSFTLLSYMKPR